jgi:hypothetical protein
MRRKEKKNICPSTQSQKKNKRGKIQNLPLAKGKSIEKQRTKYGN